MSEGSYPSSPKGLWSWLLTIDHKRIGVMYFGLIRLFFLIGGIYAILLRYSLMLPRIPNVGTRICQICRHRWNHSRPIQSCLYTAWCHYDLSCDHSIRARHAGQFPFTLDARC